MALHVVLRQSNATHAQVLYGNMSPRTLLSVIFLSETNAVMECDDSYQTVSFYKHFGIKISSVVYIHMPTQISTPVYLYIYKHPVSQMTFLAFGIYKLLSCYRISSHKLPMQICNIALPACLACPCIYIFCEQQQSQCL